MCLTRVDRIEVLEGELVCWKVLEVCIEWRLVPKPVEILSSMCFGKSLPIGEWIKDQEHMLLAREDGKGCYMTGFHCYTIYEEARKSKYLLHKWNSWTGARRLYRCRVRGQVVFGYGDGVSSGPRQVVAREIFIEREEK